MSDRVSFRRVLGAAVVIAAVFGVPSQVAGQGDARLEAKRRATAAAHDALLGLRARARTESARRGELPRIRDYAGLLVFGDSGAIGGRFLARMDSAYARVHREARALFGSSADTLLSGETLSLSTQPWSAVLRRRGGEYGVELHATGRLGAGAALESGTHPKTANLERHFVDWFSIAAGANLNPAMRQWMRPVVPLRSTAARTNSETYWLMASLEYSPTDLPVARACLNGSVVACRSALALVADGDTVGAWLDADARRRIALHTAMHSVDADLVTDRDQCVRGDDRSCRLILAHRMRRSPTPPEARMAFVRQAIVRGGAGAYERLVASQTDTIARSIEAAARVPLDTLVRAWHAGIIAARPRSPSPTGAEFLVVFASGVVLVGIATRRRP